MAADCTKETAVVVLEEAKKALQAVRAVDAVLTPKSSTDYLIAAAIIAAAVLLRKHAPWVLDLPHSS